MVIDGIKWIESKSKNGRVRPMATVGLFAVNAAFLERLPFTVLDALGIKGHNVTHNY